MSHETQDPALIMRLTSHQPHHQRRKRHFQDDNHYLEIAQNEGEPSQTRRKRGPAGLLSSFPLTLFLLCLLDPSSGSSSSFSGVQTAATNHTVAANEGTNITLKCEGTFGLTDVFWVWGSPMRTEGTSSSSGRVGRDPPGEGGSAATRLWTGEDGDLHISGVSEGDGRMYTCVDAESNQSIHTVFVKVGITTIKAMQATFVLRLV